MELQCGISIVTGLKEEVKQLYQKVLQQKHVKSYPKNFAPTGLNFKILETKISPSFKGVGRSLLFFKYRHMMFVGIEAFPGGMTTLTPENRQPLFVPPCALTIKLTKNWSSDSASDLFELSEGSSSLVCMLNVVVVSRSTLTSSIPELASIKGLISMLESISTTLDKLSFNFKSYLCWQRTGLFQFEFYVNSYLQLFSSADSSFCPVVIHDWWFLTKM